MLQDVLLRVAGSRNNRTWCIQIEDAQLLIARAALYCMIQIQVPDASMIVRT